MTTEDIDATVRMIIELEDVGVPSRIHPVNRATEAPDPHALDLVACDEAGRIVGALMATNADMYLSYEERSHPGSRAFIQALGVAPEAQNKGVARALIQVCIQKMRDRGVTVIQVTSTGNALGFYRKVRFTRRSPLTLTKRIGVS